MLAVTNLRHSFRHNMARQAKNKPSWEIGLQGAVKEGRRGWSVVNFRGKTRLRLQFPKQGNGASFVPASKFSGAVALLPGSDGQQSDAPSAKTQSKQGTGHRGKREGTWVRIRRDQWPQEWHDAGYVDPVGEPRQRASPKGRLQGNYVLGMYVLPPKAEADPDSVRGRF